MRKTASHKSWWELHKTYTMVNGEDIFRQHYKNVIHFHGEHRLDRKAIEEALIPLIRKILNEAIPYCNENENEIRVRFDEF